jgi:hypothetical protein
MIEGNVAFDGDRHRVLCAFAGKRAAGEIRRALLYALINGRMNRNSHDEPLSLKRLLRMSNPLSPAAFAGGGLP